MAQKPGKRMKLGVAFATVEYSMQGKTPTFHDLVAAVHAAEEMGVDSFWLADHLLYRFAERGEERGCWEAMTMLSALAAVTTRIALGPLVAATSFRHPALLAKMAATLDEISAGRFLLGVGTGWHSRGADKAVSASSRQARSPNHRAHSCPWRTFARDSIVA